MLWPELLQWGKQYMSGNSYWIAKYENGIETIHQDEPTYNRLQKKWLSIQKVYISSGLINQIVECPPDAGYKAICFEISGNKMSGPKLWPLNTYKIYL